MSLESSSVSLGGVMSVCATGGGFGASASCSALSKEDSSGSTNSDDSSSVWLFSC